MSPMRVAVVGAGYAGLAAAVELASAGHAVEVFEASRTLGGRARGIDVDGIRLDNGAHILVGAYRETLRLMRLVGAEPESLLRRTPLHLEFPRHFRLKAPRLPAPLHLAAALLGARGLSVGDKFAAIRFMRAMESAGFRLPADEAVSGLLARHRQPEGLRRFLWEPLCIAALNTPAAEASARVFLNVLRDSLAAGRSASDMLLPATDFSSLFPEPAAAWLQARGAGVRRETRVESVARADGGFTLVAEGGGRGPYDRVIAAVAPYHLARLLPGMPALQPALAAVDRFSWEPIVTAYLAYPGNVALPCPMAGIVDGHAQWIFDRGALCGQKGLMAAVISAHGRHEDLPAEALARRIHEEIAALVPALPPFLWQRVIAEKRATFACRPAMDRPPTATAVPGLLLAGDYVAGDYPATIEGAVRSGVAAARAAVA